MIVAYIALIASPVVMHLPLFCPREIHRWVHLDSPWSEVMCPLTLFQVGGLQVSLVVECQTRCPGNEVVWGVHIEDSTSSSLFCTDFQTSVGDGFLPFPFTVLPLAVSHTFLHVQAILPLQEEQLCKSYSGSLNLFSPIVGLGLSVEGGK